MENLIICWTNLSAANFNLHSPPQVSSKRSSWLQIFSLPHLSSELCFSPFPIDPFGKTPDRMFLPNLLTPRNLIIYWAQQSPPIPVTHPALSFLHSKRTSFLKHNQELTLEMHYGIKIEGHSCKISNAPSLVANKSKIVFCSFWMHTRLCPIYTLMEKIIWKLREIFKN